MEPKRIQEVKARILLIDSYAADLLDVPDGDLRAKLKVFRALRRQIVIVLARLK